MQLSEIQTALRVAGIDGWLFFDHHGRDPISYRILGLAAGLSPSRRWYYYVPAEGLPAKLVHNIESGILDDLPGRKTTYSSWQDQRRKLAESLQGAVSVAMQYSTNCDIPYISLVDAGTVELIRSFGIQVVSSANLVQEFEARWTRAQYDQHIEAGRRVDRVRREAFELIGDNHKAGRPISEFDVQQFIRRRFHDSGLFTDHGPIVAANENASDPHYEPSRDRHQAIREGDFVLIDMWAKLHEPHSVFYDITWTAYCGSVIPNDIQRVFETVVGARQAASRFVKDRIAANTSIAGFEVDSVARNHIHEAGFGEFFTHRTGHSIGTDIHGTGANMDNLESHDDRPIIPATCFSIEPGVYLANFGVRSEVNMFVHRTHAEVTGEEQSELLRIGQ